MSALRLDVARPNGRRLPPLRQIPRPGPYAAEGEAVRHSKLTPAVHAQIVQALEAGAYARTACDLVGIGETTFYRWLQRGEQAEHDLQHPPRLDDIADNVPEEERARLLRERRRAWAAQAREDRPYREFREAVTRASARAEVTALATVRTAALQAQQAVVVRKQGGVEEVVMVADHGARTRAAIEFLKRRFPDRWTDRQRIETDAKVALTDERLDTSQMTAEELARLDESLAALDDAGLLG